MKPSLCPWPPCLLFLSLCPWSWHQLHCCAPRRAPWPRQLQDIINLNSDVTSSRKASLNTCSHSPAVLSASVCSTGVSPRAVLPQGTLGDEGMSVAVTTWGGGSGLECVGPGILLDPHPQCPRRSPVSAVPREPAGSTPRRRGTEGLVNGLPGGPADVTPARIPGAARVLRVPVLTPTAFTPVKDAHSWQPGARNTHRECCQTLLSVPPAAPGFASFTWARGCPALRARLP